MSAFAGISASVDLRLVEIRKLFAFIEQLEKDKAPLDIRHNLLGMLFVSLYSPYEFAISNSIRVVVTEINKKGHPLSDFDPLFYSVVLHSDFESLLDSGKEKKWKARVDLLSKIQSNIPVVIPEAVSPNGGKNYRYEQLEYLWKCFCIRESIFPNNDLKYRGRVEELVRRRNEIAHGSVSATDIGKQYTMTELKEIIRDVGTYINYVLVTFEKYIEEQAYRKVV